MKILLKKTRDEALLEYISHEYSTGKGSICYFVFIHTDDDNINGSWYFFQHRRRFSIKTGDSPYPVLITKLKFQFNNLNEKEIGNSWRTQCQIHSTKRVLTPLISESSDRRFLDPALPLEILRLSEQKKKNNKTILQNRKRLSTRWGDVRIRLTLKKNNRSNQYSRMWYASCEKETCQIMCKIFEVYTSIGAWNRFHVMHHR